MSIEKKSLISTLKTTKKANVVASSELNPKASNITSKKVGGANITSKTVLSRKKTLRSYRAKMIG